MSLFLKTDDGISIHFNNGKPVRAEWFDPPPPLDTEEGPLEGEKQKQLSSTLVSMGFNVEVQEWKLHPHQDVWGYVAKIVEVKTVQKGE